MYHKKLQHFTTTKVLELLHMDLMRPMKVESMGGKSYVFVCVCVDEFLRYTWIDFIKENLTLLMLSKIYVNVSKEKKEVR